MIKTLEMISLKNTDHDLTDLLLYFEGHDTEYTLYRELMSVLEPLLPENFSVRCREHRSASTASTCLEPPLFQSDGKRIGRRIV